VFAQLHVEGRVNVRVMNMLGQQLTNVMVENTDEIIEIPLQDEWNGILFITFSGEFGEITKKTD